jgi:hypothetical protein
MQDGSELKNVLNYNVKRRNVFTSISLGYLVFSSFIDGASTK